MPGPSVPVPVTVPGPVTGAVMVDARGLRCPWPALRLARAMRGLGDGATVRLLADDPRAGPEVAALAREHGWTVTTVAAGDYIVSAETTIMELS